MPPLRLLIVLLVLAAATPAPAATPPAKVPGQSYFGTARHVEYIAGDLPLVITVPHGGRAQPADLPPRQKGVTVMDANTQELARELVAELERLSGGRVHLILSHLHRSRLDPNREIVEAANGNPGAYAVQHEEDAEHPASG